jgi:hypothetical protein
MLAQPRARRTPIPPDDTRARPTQRTNHPHEPAAAGQSHRRGVSTPHAESKVTGPTKDVFSRLATDLPADRYPPNQSHPHDLETTILKLTQSYSNADAVLISEAGGIPVRAVVQVDANGVPVVPGGTNVVAIPAGQTTDTVLKTGPGRLTRVLVTAPGTGGGTTLIRDSATGTAGTVIAAIPQTASPGTAQKLEMPAQTGLVVIGDTGNPGLTISYI